MASSSFDSDNGFAPRARLFGRQRPLHAALGGGKVADILLWRDRRSSAAMLIAVGAVWFLFEVVEYTFISLLCHIFITAMLLIFIWSTGADFFNWTPPRIPKLELSDSTFRELAFTFHAKLNYFLGMLLYIACGNEPTLFVLATVSLWILSLVGNYISTANLLFLGMLCLQTIPFLYERYEEQVDEVASKTSRMMSNMYRKLDANVLRKIPRGTKDE